MSTRLQNLDGQRHDGVMDFMYNLQIAGYESEFDNSLVMQTLWKKNDEVISLAGGDRAVYLVSTVRPNQSHGSELVVEIRHKSFQGPSASITLYERNGRIAVFTDVLAEEVKPIPGDLPVSGSMLHWNVAEKLFDMHPKFDKTAKAAFNAVYEAIAPKDGKEPCLLQFNPGPKGVYVIYAVAGKKIFSATYEYNK